MPMPPTHLQGVLPCLRHLFAAKGSDHVPDAELVRRFGEQRDEAAFELLIWRHGRMVWHVCRRIIGDVHEAEDAFQATFLTLSRRAGSIRKQASVPSWLHKVASRISFAARARLARRKARERPLDQPLAATTPDPVTSAAWQELGKILDVELAGLADRYRVPFILCYLEGKTNAEAARELGCPVGTIESRLIRARERLRARLTRRGVALSAGLVVLDLRGTTGAASMPAALVGSTARAASLYAAGGSAGHDIISAKVLSMTEGILRTMFFSKLKVVALAALLMTIAGAGFFARSAMASGKPDNKQGASPKPAANAGQASVQAPAPIIESGTIKRIDLKEGTILLQKQTRYVSATLFNSPYLMAQASNTINSPYVVNTINFPCVVAQPRAVWLDPVNPYLIAGTNNTIRLDDIHLSPNVSNWVFPQVAPQNWAGIYAANQLWFGNTDVLLTEVQRRFGPVVDVRIDGKDGKLADLPPHIWVTLTLDKDGRVTRIQADGTAMDDCIADSLDPIKRKLAVKHHDHGYQYEIAANVEVMINGRKATLAELRPDMPVSLRFSAIKQAIITITAVGPLVECVLKGIDAERGSMTVSLKKEHLTVPNLTVAADVEVKIDGHDARLVDLKSRIGKRVGIRMDADPERNRVLGIYCTPAKSN